MTDNTAMEGGKQEVERFLADWTGSREEVKTRFSSFFEYLSAMDGVHLNFVARPGVSYSLRPVRREQVVKGRELFAMVDVIDDDPKQRWLSVCFYGDMITDPEGQGEVIPGGLGGADGYCFDMFEDDAALASYLLERLAEANEAAKN